MSRPSGHIHRQPQQLKVGAEVETEPYIINSSIGDHLKDAGFDILQRLLDLLQDEVDDRPRFG